MPGDERGDLEVFLGGSRLQRFIEGVERVTTAIPAPIVEEPPPPEGTAPLPFERVRDERTGQNYLKIRIPEPDIVDQVAGALQALLASLRT